MMKSEVIELPAHIQYERDKTIRVLDEFAKALKEPAEDCWIWEGEFRNYFLPRIMKIIQDEDNLWIGQWMDIAKSPAARMGIKSETTGEILFHCPPLLDTRSLGNYKSSRNFGDVVINAKRKSGNIPSAGDAYLNHNLVNVENDLLEGYEPKEEHDWTPILARYGYIEEGVTEKVTDSETVVEELSVDDMFS